VQISSILRAFILTICSFHFRLSFRFQLEHIHFWVFSGCRLQITVGKLSLGEAQWIGKWSSVLFYLTVRIASPLEPVVNTMFFIAKVIGLSTICKVMHVSFDIVFMTGNI
jgi:hypothetical protein